MSKTIVIAGIDTPIGAALAERYRAAGAVVGGDESIPESVDLLIVADDFVAPARKAIELRRAEFEAGLARLTFGPFSLANRLRAHLAASGGKAVLVTRSLAGMTVPDDAGRYLERPFRAAAHALWRTMSVEWKAEGVACAIVVMDDPAGADAAIATIDALETPPEQLCVPMTPEGVAVGW